MLKAVWQAAAASTAHEVRGLKVAKMEVEQRIDEKLAQLARDQATAAAQAARGFPEPIKQQVDVVPGWLSVAPPAIMGLSVVLSVMNTFGVFGEGPDLSALVK